MIRMDIENEKLKRNGSGYPDPTAYAAIKNVDASSTSTYRFYKLLEIIFNICELSGFHLEERIVVKDKKTGKIWR
jgi:hypothetical protein